MHSSARVRRGKRDVEWSQKQMLLHSSLCLFCSCHSALFLSLLLLRSGSDVAGSKAGCEQCKLNQKKASLFWVKKKKKRKVCRGI